MKALNKGNGWAVEASLSIGALALSTGCAVALLAPTSLGRLTQWCLFLCSALVAACVADYLRRRQVKQLREARQFITRLADFDQPGQSASAVLDSLPSIDNGTPCASALFRLRDVLAAQAARQADADHARTALELRCRREAAEKERALAIVDKIDAPVLVVDQFDELLLANETAESLLSLDLGKAETRVFSRLAHCDKLVALLADARRRKGPVAKSEDIEFETAGGERRAYNVLVTNLADEANADEQSGSQGVVAVLRDVSTTKELLRSHAEFVSNASHEMKAPLAGIKAYVEMLADGEAEDAETRDQFLEVIAGQTERLQRLIENLLNIARIEAGVVKVSKQSQSLNDVLNDAIRVVQPMAEAKQISLRAELSPLYLGVFVDRDLMLQGALNLLSNAVKYTAPGGLVTLRSRLDDGQVQFEVEDTGVGLSPKDCQRVFEKFYRVEKDTQMASGTGLGLPLARHIVEDVHGGKLTLTSQLGVGSTFRINLPAANRNT
ncbi:MAG: hypothetical protein JSS27_13365 [Planctomycetes bacterium]|nr:hypothetical protein [Planctomycetota bacterium]